MDAEHPRLVHLAAVVVGTPDSGVALRGVQRDHGCARDSDGLLALRIGRHCPGDRRAGYVVLLRTTSLYGLWVAGEYDGYSCVLSHAVAGDRLRYSVLLGGSDDHAGLPLHARCADGGWFSPNSCRGGTVS